MRVELANDTIDRSDREALAQWVLSDPRLTKGPETVALEGEFAARIGTRHAVYVNSGSSANLLMVAALKESGRLRNNVAIVPAISWATTVTPFLQLGFEVHLCDADRHDLGLDIDHLRSLIIEHRPSVIALVHVLGHANHLEEILELCRQHEVLLVEDACEALGSLGPGRRSLGAFGLVGSFSMYYGHHLSTIEGGFIVTDDEEIHELLVALRSHGWARDLGKERRAELAREHEIDEFREQYTFYYAGYNLRATDLQAFIGRRQLTRLTEVALARSDIFAAYQRGLPEFFVQTSSTPFLSAFAYGTMVTRPSHVAARLADEGIESRPLICGNIGRHPFWTGRFGAVALTIADQVHDRGIYLPIHAGMADEDVQHVIDVFRGVAEPYMLA